MFLEGKKFLPVMCYIDDNYMDIGGNIYPEYGFISAKEFTDDNNIQYGLYGIPWGRTDNLLYEKIDSGNWVVIKTEINDELIKTDCIRNRVKFRNGMVLKVGSANYIGEFIYENREKHNFSKLGKYVKKDEIVGTKKWMKKYYKEN